jgi:hypothetical protein
VRVKNEDDNVKNQCFDDDLRCLKEKGKGEGEDIRPLRRRLHVASPGSM